MFEIFRIYFISVTRKQPYGARKCVNTYKFRCNWLRKSKRKIWVDK